MKKLAYMNGRTSSNKKPILTNMSNYDESKHLKFDESGLCIFSVQPNGKCFCSICEDNVETSEN